MHALRKQRTISNCVAVEGFGLWSGRDVRAEFRPAGPDTGIVFVRHDMPRPARIQAVVAHRIETPRRTTLSADGGAVEMIEHVMAALAGLHIDNCEVWVNEPEMPGCDGSSLPFVTALESAGIVEQEAWRQQIIVRDTIRLGSEDSWIEIRPTSAGVLSVKFRLDYGSDSPIGRQSFQLPITPESFRRELAACRTFVLQEEADWLIARGLGRRASYQNLVVFDKQGPIQNELRFRDECVRHKTLDLVGDLALAGCDLVGHVVAYRSGHRLNSDLVCAVLQSQQLAEWRRSA